MKTRLLCTISALAVMGRQTQLAANVYLALGAGATREEIREVILQIGRFRWVLGNVRCLGDAEGLVSGRVP